MTIYLNLKEKVYLYQKLHTLFYTATEQNKDLIFTIKEKILKELKKDIQKTKDKIEQLNHIANLSYLYENIDN
jgi:hypothetical protein